MAILEKTAGETEGGKWSDTGNVFAGTEMCEFCLLHFDLDLTKRIINCIYYTYRTPSDPVGHWYRTGEFGLCASRKR